MRASRIKEIKSLKQRAVTTNPGTKTPIYIRANVVKNHCLHLPSGLGEGKNLICAFFAGPRCHKEFHFPLFIYLYFTDGSCSWASSPPLPLTPCLKHPTGAFLDSSSITDKVKWALLISGLYEISASKNQFTTTNSKTNRV